MSLSLFFRWNSFLIPPLGFLLNFTLLWLIIRRTPKEMWLHSRVLLQTCIFDIMLLCAFMFGMSYGILIEDKSFVIFEGYLLGSQLNIFDLNDPNCMLNLFCCCWLFLYSFDVMGIAVQFLYRYLVLNRGIKINLRRYLCLLIIPLIVGCSNIFIIQKSFKQAIASPAEFSSIYFDFNDTKIIYGILEFDKFLIRIELSQCLLFYGISYSIIFICGHKMVKYVKAHAMHVNLKALNKQLSRSLIICASYPLIMEAVHMLMIISIVMPSLMNASMVLSSIFHWLPILNPLANFWTFRPYREALIVSEPFKKARILPQ